MSNIVCFGEIMMRLNPEGYQRFLQAERFEASYAGGEANVAVSLANFGENAAFVSKVPAHEIGQCAVNALRHYGVDTSFMLRGGARLGIYYVEKGASQRGSKVIYDRAGSAVALAKAAEFDWKRIFTGKDWFHFTGITPALGGDMPQACLEAVRTAREMNLKVSCDLNYRGKLWTREQAGTVMETLMPYVDVLIANEEDARDVFGIAAKNSDVNAGRLDNKGYEDVARQLHERFRIPTVAITLRGSVSASDNNWSAMLLDGGKAFFAQTYPIRIVDRVGGGDSFGGALIHAMLKWPGDSARNLEFATAASCLKQTIEFDFNLVSEQEVLALMQGNASGRVQR